MSHVCGGITGSGERPGSKAGIGHPECRLLGNDL